MAKKINTKEYDAWSKEELIKEIIKIKSTTYGLVWHRDLPEEKIVWWNCVAGKEELALS